MAGSGRDGTVAGWMSSLRSPLVGFVLPFVNGDVHAAEDVVQETMIRGWLHAGAEARTCGVVAAHGGP